MGDLQGLSRKWARGAWVCGLGCHAEVVRIDLREIRPTQVRKGWPHSSPVREEHRRRRASSYLTGSGSRRRMLHEIC